MKIGIVTEYYFPYLGGIAEHVHYSYKHFKKMGFDVKIITSHMSGLKFKAPRAKWWAPDSDIIRIGKSYPFYSNGGFVRFTSPLFLATRLKKVFQRESFDILHVHAPFIPILPMVAIRHADCPSVGTVHTYFKKSTAYKIFKFYVKTVIDKLDGLIAVSPMAAERYYEYFDDLNFTIIPNGIDTEVYTPENKPIKELKKDGVLNILFVGRFDPHNGLPLMIKAFEKVKQSYRNCRLIVVGDGPLGSYYKRQIPPWLSSSIYFAGLQHEKKPQFYATADIFCHPATLHNLSIVMLEAMASGLPIVASDIHAFKWLLRDNCLYFNSGNIDELAGKILQLLSDRNLRMSIGQKARQRAEFFSWEKISMRLVSYYKSVLEGTAERILRPVPKPVFDIPPPAPEHQLALTSHYDRPSWKNVTAGSPAGRTKEWIDI